MGREIPHQRPRSHAELQGQRGRPSDQPRGAGAATLPPGRVQRRAGSPLRDRPDPEAAARDPGDPACAPTAHPLALHVGQRRRPVRRDRHLRREHRPRPVALHSKPEAQLRGRGRRRFQHPGFGQHPGHRQCARGPARGPCHRHREARRGLGDRHLEAGQAGDRRGGDAPGSLADRLHRRRRPVAHPGVSQAAAAGHPVARRRRSAAPAPGAGGRPAGFLILRRLLEPGNHLWLGFGAGRQPEPRAPAGLAGGGRLRAPLQGPGGGADLPPLLHPGRHRPRADLQPLGGVRRTRQHRLGPRGRPRRQPDPAAGPDRPEARSAEGPGDLSPRPGHRSHHRPRAGVHRPASVRLPGPLHPGSARPEIDLGPGRLQSLEPAQLPLQRDRRVQAEDLGLDVHRVQAQARSRHAPGTGEHRGPRLRAAALCL